ncbi:hypothetical protein RRF57_008230 [Xylaria bambusicola]|uniref:Uncharacterized protein n=1 Tax=Xylaria bambusicola TaxID=326684 RepID=A0AAN7UUY7_9PEZI
MYWRIGSFIVKGLGDHDKVVLSNNTHLQVLSIATSVNTQEPYTVQDEVDRVIDQVTGEGISLEDGLKIPHDEYRVSALSENYMAPSAHTVTVTSSVKAIMGADPDDTHRSNCPMGIRPGFGFSSIPIVEELIVSAAMLVAWIATWVYL